MVYCRICHKSKPDEHFLDFPEHARAQSKADKAPRGGRLISAEEQPEQAPRSPRPETPGRPKRARPPQRAEAEQGGQIPGGWLLAGLGVLGAAFGGMAAYNYRQKKAQQGNQDGQSQRIKIEPEGDSQGDSQGGG